jgi:hypothetical protein
VTVRRIGASGGQLFDFATAWALDENTSKNIIVFTVAANDGVLTTTYDGVATDDWKYR